MDNNFYQAHLNRVSRSFAFCIEQLHSPLREWVGLSYLLCRLADTVEDSAWPSLHEQKNAFETFLAFVQSPQWTAQDVSMWAATFPQHLPPSEQQLLQDSPILLRHLHDLPSPVHQALRQTLCNMTRGMMHFCQTSLSPRLHSLTQTNQYCFFVAGVIGELLTQLLDLDEPEFKPSHQNWVDGVHFGLFLQKVNLLKDQRGDELVGRRLVFSRAAVHTSLAHNAKHAWHYLRALPTRRADFRVFCAWSLFLGLASLPWIEKSWHENAPLKISREETTWLLEHVRILLDQPQELESLFLELLPHSQEIHSTQNSENNTNWLGSFYVGQLQPDDFKALGLGSMAPD